MLSLLHRRFVYYFRWSIAMKCFVALFLAFATVANAFAPSSRMVTTKPRVAPLNENFGLDFAEDSYGNTPSRLLGEVNYKNFVAEVEPSGLLVRGDNYNIIERVRALQLLKVTAQSGLLEALEKKGLTLSQVEKLLPLADDLGALSLLLKNKELLLSAAPLLIEPAPALIPVAVNVLNTPPSTFSTLGAALLAAGAFEVFEGNGLLGAPLGLLGVPLIVLSSILSNGIPLPSAGRSSSSSSASVNSKDTFAPPVQTGNRPAAKASAAVADRSNKQNGKRKVIRVNSR